MRGGGGKRSYSKEDKSKWRKRKVESGGDNSQWLRRV